MYEPFIGYKGFIDTQVLINGPSTNQQPVCPSNIFKSDPHSFVSRVNWMNFIIFRALDQWNDDIRSLLVKHCRPQLLWRQNYVGNIFFNIRRKKNNGTLIHRQKFTFGLIKIRKIKQQHFLFKKYYRLQIELISYIPTYLCQSLLQIDFLCISNNMSCLCYVVHVWLHHLRSR